MNYQSIQEFNMEDLLTYNKDGVSSIGNTGFSSEFIKNVFQPIALAVADEFGMHYFDNIVATQDGADTVISFYNGDYATGKRMDIKPVNFEIISVKAWNGSKSIIADNDHDGDTRSLINKAHAILG